MAKQPIGVIDSGVGGLTVWQELVATMPDESYVYFGDSGFCPYGLKTAFEITSRVGKTIDFLIENRCRIIVIACNAITAASIDYLRRHYCVPFVGMEPAVKPALAITKTGAIGVLATRRTLKGDPFRRTKAIHGQGKVIVEQVGHGLVERVERLDFDSASTMAHLNDLLQPMVEKNIDVLVLGCTHYPFLQPAINKITGDGVTILNPAPAIARQTANVRQRCQSRSGPPADRGDSVFYTTGDREIMRRLLARLHPAACEVKSIVI